MEFWNLVLLWHTTAACHHCCICCYVRNLFVLLPVRLRKVQARTMSLGMSPA